MDPKDPTCLTFYSHDNTILLVHIMKANVLYLKEQCLEIFYTRKELCCVISGCACFVLCVVCTKMQQFKGTVSRDFEMPNTKVQTFKLCVFNNVDE